MRDRRLNYFNRDLKRRPRFSLGVVSVTFAAAAAVIGASAVAMERGELLRLLWIVNPLAGFGCAALDLRGPDAADAGAAGLGLVLNALLLLPFVLLVWSVVHG